MATPLRAGRVGATAATLHRQLRATVLDLLVCTVSEDEVTLGQAIVDDCV